MSSASTATVEAATPCGGFGCAPTGAELVASAASPIAATVEQRTCFRLISILPFQIPGLPPVVELILYQIGSGGRRNRPTRSRSVRHRPEDLGGRYAISAACVGGRRHFRIIPGYRTAQRRSAGLPDATRH